jgi:PKD repeat protein
MAIPVAAFTFEDTEELDRTVKFTDGSSNVPITWVWDFGDSTPTNNTQNPTHQYAANGTYKVKLTASNVDGANTLNYTIVVGAGVVAIPGIKEIVKMELPSEIDMTDAQIELARKNWMIVFSNAEQVEANDTFDEYHWRPITRLLIARLIIYDYIIQRAQNGLISLGATGAGGLKAIQVGPSRTEWYQATESWRNAISEGGQVSLLTSSLCLLAGQVGVYLPMCQKRNVVVPPKVYTLG